MDENHISKIVLGEAIAIHRELGPGLFESVYEEILYRELNKKGLQVSRQEIVPIRYKGEMINKGFRADLIVNNKVIIEVKSIEKVSPIHFKQLLNYLRLKNFKLGLLLNFNEALLKNGIKRIVNKL